MKVCVSFDINVQFTDVVKPRPHIEDVERAVEQAVRLAITSNGYQLPTCILSDEISVFFSGPITSKIVSDHPHGLSDQ